MRKGNRERKIDLLFHLFMHSFVDSCMCPDQGSNMNVGVLGKCSDQLSYPARSGVNSLISILTLRNFGTLVQGILGGIEKLYSGGFEQWLYTN